jgi:hypothetical protein
MSRKKRVRKEVVAMKVKRTRRGRYAIKLRVKQIQWLDYQNAGSDEDPVDWYRELYVETTDGEMLTVVFCADREKAVRFRRVCPRVSDGWLEPKVYEA